jgi:hypothetical protein
MWIVILVPLSTSHLIFSRDVSLVVYIFFSFLSHDNENTQLSFICLLFAWVTQELSDPSIMGLTNTSDPTFLGLAWPLDPRLMGLA